MDGLRTAFVGFDAMKGGRRVVVVLRDCGVDGEIIVTARFVLLGGFATRRERCSVYERVSLVARR